MTGAVHLRRSSGGGLQEVRVTCNEQDNLEAEVTAALVVLSVLLHRAFCRSTKTLFYFKVHKKKKFII